MIFTRGARFMLADGSKLGTVQDCIPAGYRNWLIKGQCDDGTLIIRPADELIPAAPRPKYRLRLATIDGAEV